MAVSRVKQYSLLLLLLLVSFSLVLYPYLGKQSPASHHSCSHGHHHHDSISDHDHHHSDEAVKLLPEESSEEEDLKMDGFDSDHHHHHHDHDHGNAGSKLYGVGLWVYAMGCSLLVSMASLICLTIIPILCAHGKPSKAVVDSLALFGAGAMLGDAFLHQLPHAFSGGHSDVHDHHVHSENSHSHAHSLEDLSIGLSILSGIIVFLIVEKVVRLVEEVSGGEHSWAHAHHHHHHHKTSKKLKDEDDGHDKSQQKLSKEKKLDGDADGPSNSEKLVGSQTQMRKRNRNASPSDGKSVDDENGKVGKEKTAIQPSNRVFGYLNLFSDGVHNFTDGMALGSAFLLYGSVGGWSRTLFLLAHELPQEVGDFGILVRSGLCVKGLILQLPLSTCSISRNRTSLASGPGSRTVVSY